MPLCACGCGLTVDGSYRDSKKKILVLRRFLPRHHSTITCQHGMRPRKICEKCKKAKSARYRNGNRDKIRSRFHVLKIEIINIYSNGTMACANPFGEHKEPYTNICALTIDHIYGGGTKMLKQYSSIYYWLKMHNYPTGYQVLCINCNFIKKELDKISNAGLLNAKKLYLSRYQQSIKIIAMSMVSFDNIMCANPFGEHKEPYTNRYALTIDHIDEGGAKHRREIGNSHLYLWIIENSDISNFQVLCINCQFIKTFNFKNGLMPTA